LRIAYGLLYTQRGIPCVFYGSELLMDGAGPHGIIRRDFPGGWPGDSIDLFQYAQLSPAQRELHDWLRALSAIRSQHPAHFQTGRRIQYIPQDSAYAYFITSGDTVLGFFIHTGNSPRRLQHSQFPDLHLNWRSAQPLTPHATTPESQSVLLPARSFSAFRWLSPVETHD
jgi:glycosidase